jgi:hypothetical protein
VRSRGRDGLSGDRAAQADDGARRGSDGARRSGAERRPRASLAERRRGPVEPHLTLEHPVERPSKNPCLLGISRVPPMPVIGFLKRVCAKFRLVGPQGTGYAEGEKRADRIPRQRYA